MESSSGRQLALPELLTGLANLWILAIMAFKAHLFFEVIRLLETEDSS
jgi:hypothetical protein